MILKLPYAKLLPAPAVLFLPFKKSPAGYQIVIYYMIIDPNGAKISIIKKRACFQALQILLFPASLSYPMKADSRNGISIMLPCIDITE